jgi:hypothetical protein
MKNRNFCYYGFMKRKIIIWIFAIFVLFSCKTLIKDGNTMKDITDLSEAKLKTGDEVSYSYTRYESVGYDAEFEVSDPSVLMHLKTDVNYHNPLRMKMGMSGADDATGTFIFKAMNSGTADLIVKHMFRGKVEEEKKIRVIVE